MYPLEGEISYPREQWYVAAYQSEINESVLARRILGDDIIFFRSNDGVAHALSGRCMHRFMPLASASIKDDSVVCPYHGYAYGSDGRCVAIPTGGPISSHARLKRYPLIERGPFAWIWMGNPESPDESRLPDLADIGLNDGQSDWCIDVGGTLPMKARAALLVDNLFDLSHGAFIHSSTLHDFGEIVMIPPSIDTMADRLRVSRTLFDVEFPSGSYFDRLFPVTRGRGTLCNVLHTDMYSPGLINSTGPWIYEQTTDGKQGGLVAKLNFVHGITPETDTTTHYFGVVTRDYEVENAQLSRMLIAQTDAVRTEDIAAFEAVEMMIDASTTTKREISTKVDEGAIKARRFLNKLIKAEEIIKIH